MTFPLSHLRAGSKDPAYVRTAHVARPHVARVPCVREKPRAGRCRPGARMTKTRLEREAHAETEHAWVHDLQHVVRRADPQVVLPAEHRGGVQRVEDVEVEVEAGTLERELLADAQVERG